MLSRVGAALMSLAAEAVKRRLLAYLDELTPGALLSMVKANTFPWDSVPAVERSRLLEQLRAHKSQVLALTPEIILSVLAKSRPDLWSILQNSANGRGWLDRGLSTLKALANSKSV